MYLSDRDLQWAREQGLLIVDPPPEPKDIGPTSIDLHLDSVEEAKVWDLTRLKEHNRHHGLGDKPFIRLETFNYKKLAGHYLTRPDKDENKLVYRMGDEIVVKPSGFLLWQTREKVGTPEEGAQLIC